MRVCFFGALILSIPSPAVFAQSAPSTFDFKGFVAGAAVPDGMLKQCRRSGRDAVCTVYPTTISNIRVGYQVTVYNSKLSTVYVEAYPVAYPEIMEAFVAKYGSPCKVEDLVWTNAMGARLPNPTTQWCFNSGTLTVAKYGKTIDHMLIYYRDDNQPVPPPPKVDF